MLIISSKQVAARSVRLSASAGAGPRFGFFEALDRRHDSAFRSRLTWRISPIY